MCSQALPAIGSTIIPRKAWLSPVLVLNSSIELHRNLQAQQVAAPESAPTTQHVAVQDGRSVCAAGIVHVPNVTTNIQVVDECDECRVRVHLYGKYKL
jgi:hypothetical protein